MVEILPRTILAVNTIEQQATAKYLMHFTIWHTIEKKGLSSF